VGRRFPIVFVLVVAALAAPAAAYAYDWPLRPYKRQHPIRGGFDDPRITYSAGAAIGAAFHFGVDISAPDNTPVYSVSSGVAYPGAQKVRVRVSGRQEFAYWHINPVVTRGQPIRLHQLLGYIVAPHAHVHFAEKLDGIYVNPLRRGGLAPYTDHTRPTVASVTFVSTDRVVTPDAVSGVVDVVTDAYDTPPLAPSVPWNAPKLAPALIRWRIVGASPELAVWQTAVDFRWSLLPQSEFWLVYAPGTRQNKANRPGQYMFYLRQAWDTTELANGSYTLEVQAIDMRGNVGTRAQPFVVAN
jgi:hypothetical protein